MHDSMKNVLKINTRPQKSKAMDPALLPSVNIEDPSYDLHLTYSFFLEFNNT